MLIYRIENSKGIGPYHDGAIHNVKSSDMFYGKHCPGPFTDNIYQVNKEFYYGFQSMWHLRRWFNKQVRKETSSFYKK